MEGVVKTVVTQKGFGFAKTEDGSEFFFHRSGCFCDFNTLQEGDKVSFEPKKTPKGWRAENVVTL